MGTRHCHPTSISIYRHTSGSTQKMTNYMSQNPRCSTRFGRASTRRAPRAFQRVNALRRFMQAYEENANHTDDALTNLKKPMLFGGARIKIKCTSSYRNVSRFGRCKDLHVHRFARGARCSSNRVHAQLYDLTNETYQNVRGVKEVTHAYEVLFAMHSGSHAHRVETSTQCRKHLPSWNPTVSLPARASSGYDTRRRRQTTSRCPLQAHHIDGRLCLFARLSALAVQSRAYDFMGTHRNIGQFLHPSRS